jgi:hypothetical protein
MQLLNKINTISYTNQILRQKNHLTGIGTILRDNKINLDAFRVFSDLKQLVLDIGRQVNAEIITDVAIIMLKPGENSKLNNVNNRIILALETQSTFIIEDKQLNIESGSLLWTDENINIINTSATETLLLVIDFEEFIIL